MPNLSSWEFICRHASDIPPGVPRTFTPPGARECVNPEILERMGGTVAQLYPEFSAAFPLTSAAIQHHYGPPLLALATVMLSWTHIFILEGAADNILFDSVGAGIDTSGPDFDQHRAMLPLPWVELYRWFNSFSITPLAMAGGGHFNTPSGYSSRLDAQEIRYLYVRKGIKIAKREVDQFLRRMDSDEMMCWLYTEAGDTLWIDEQRLDRKVYHARAQKLSDVMELPDPGGTLDRYMAHVVAAGKPADFDFRRD